MSEHTFRENLGVATMGGTVGLFILYLGVVSGWWGADTVVVSVIKNHPAAMIGLPAAFLIALFVVLLLEITTGKIRFKIPGFEFDGAAGPVILWALCFSLTAGAIHVLW